MPPCAHSISAGRPAAPDDAPCPVFRGLLESAKGIAVRCLCLGDFFPHDSGIRSGTTLAAMCPSLLKILGSLWQMSFPPTAPQTSSHLRPCLNLVNQIRRCTPVQRSIARTEISKRQG